jgi:hypothetical protein
LLMPLTYEDGRAVRYASGEASTQHHSDWQRRSDLPSTMSPQTSSRRRRSQ